MRIREVVGPSVNRALWGSYGQYLRSARWADLKREVRARSGGGCERCVVDGRLRIGSHVHHVRYPAVWGFEEADDLLHLCVPCHREAHDLQ
jgi:hypothetical protein